MPTRVEYLYLLHPLPTTLNPRLMQFPMSRRHVTRTRDRTDHPGRRRWSNIRDYCTYVTLKIKFPRANNAVNTASSAISPDTLYARYSKLQSIFHPYSRTHRDDKFHISELKTIYIKLLRNIRTSSRVSTPAPKNHYQ